MKLLQILGVFASALLPALAMASDCESVAATVSQQVEESPEKVLMVVEDAMAKHEKCACEVVKAAIVASKANEKLVGEIVFTAVISSESMAPTVAECAISVAPDSASHIRSALKRALSDTGTYSYDGGGGKSPAYSGKNPAYGKEPIPSAEAVDDGGFDFGRAPLDVRGIYLLAPSPGGGFVSTTRNFDIPKSLAREFKRIYGYYPKGLDRDEVVKLIKRTEKESGSTGGHTVIVVTPSDPSPKK
ncbi:MAG: hypothetical protein ACI9R3_000407 [Verrucomicrobiales bacterium]|jgi:hypothetical protein